MLLVTEMTFTESWPALQSSRAPPHTHTHTQSPLASRAPGGCVLESGVLGQVFPGFSLHRVFPPRSPPLTPAQAHCPQSTQLSPAWVLSGRPAPASLGNTGDTAQSPPPRFPSGGQKPPRGSVRLGLGQRRRTPASLQQGPRGHTEDLCTTRPFFGTFKSPWLPAGFYVGCGQGAALLPPFINSVAKDGNLRKIS